MAETVDSIIAELELRYSTYEQSVRNVIALNKEMRASFDGAGGDDKAAEASATRKIAARRRQTDAERQASREEAAAVKAAEREKTQAAKAAAKERADAAKSVAKAEADAARDAARATREREEAERRLAVASRQATREQIENLERLRRAEREATNQARANAFLSSGGGGKSARESAAAFREAFKAQDAADAKAAANAVVETEEQAQARLTAVVERGLAERAAAVRKSSDGTIGAAVPGRAVAGRQTEIAKRTVVPGEAVDTANAKEINHLALDTFDLQRRARVFKGQELADIQREVEFRQRIAAYTRQGLSDEQAVIRATAEIAALDAKRAGDAEKLALADAAQARSRRLSGISTAAGRFAEGAGLGRTGGSGAAITGLVAAGGITAGAAAISSAAKYGQDIADTAKELGLSARDLQVYQQAGQRVGVTNEQLSASFRQLADNVSRAKEGDQSLQKIFRGALNIDVSKFHDLNDALPTIIDRFAKIRDPLERAALGQKLFGDQFERLDGFLSQGNGKIKAFGDALGDSILSDDQIARLKDTSVKIDEVSNALKNDVRGVVADNAKAIEGLATSLGKLTGEVIHFLNAHPEQALAIVGALAGGRVGGPIGAAIGGAAGAYEGEKLKRSAQDSNTDISFRKQQYQAAIGNLNAARAAQRGDTPSDGGSLFGGLIRYRYTKSADDGAGSGATVKSAQAEVARQRQLYIDAQAAARASPKLGNVQSGDPNPKGIAEAFAPKPPKGKSADELVKEAAARQKRFEDERASLNDDLLSSLRDLSQGADEQTRLDAATLKNARDRRNVDIDLQVKEKQIDAAKASELKQANELAYQGRLAVLALARRVSLYEQQTAVIQQGHAFEREHLQNQAPFANSTAARRRLALAEIDVDQQTEHDDATRTLFDPSASDRDKVIAGGVLRTNQERADERRAAAIKENQGPLADYVDRLPKSAEQVRDAFEQAAVSGVESFNDRLDKSIGKMLHLHGLAGQLLQDFIKIALEHEEAALFGTLTGGLGGGGGIGGLIKGLFGGHRAGGGPVQPGRVYEVGERGRELFSPSVAGTIIPNHAIDASLGNRPIQSVRGGDTHVYEISVNAENSVTPAGFASGLAGQILQEVDKRVARSSTATLNAAPAKVRRSQVLGD